MITLDSTFFSFMRSRTPSPSIPVRIRSMMTKSGLFSSMSFSPPIPSCAIPATSYNPLAWKSPASSFANPTFSCKMTIVLFINPSANSVAIILQYSHVDCKGFLDIICKKLNYFTIFCSKLHFPRFTDMIFTKIVEVSSNLQKTIIFSKKKFRKRPRVILPNRRSRGAGESRAETPVLCFSFFAALSLPSAANVRLRRKQNHRLNRCLQISCMGKLPAAPSTGGAYMIAPYCPAPL